MPEHISFNYTEQSVQLGPFINSYMTYKFVIYYFLFIYWNHSERCRGKNSKKNCFKSKEGPPYYTILMITKNSMTRNFRLENVYSYIEIYCIIIQMTRCCAHGFFRCATAASCFTRIPVDRSTLSACFPPCASVQRTFRKYR